MTGITQIEPKTFDTSGIFSIKEAADIVSSYGREGDTYIVHAAEGETVVPMEVLDANPRMKQMLFKQMREMGLEPERYIVGNELNSINPETGQPEFFLGKIFDGLKDVVKKVAPIALAIAAPYLLPAMPLALSSGIGSFAGNLISGASPEDALKSALLTGATAGAGSYLGGKGFFGTGQQAQQGIEALKSQGVEGATKEVGKNIVETTKSAGKGVADLLGPNRPSIMPDAKIAQAREVIKNTGIAESSPAAQQLLLDAAKQPTMLEKFGPIAGTTLGVAGVADALTAPEEEDIEFKDPRQLYLANLGRYGLGDNFFGTNPFYQDPGFQPVRVNEGGEIIGPGTPTSDSIPAMLSDGEFVFNAKSVRGAGKGDRKAGAKRMYNMMKEFEKSAMA
jgi:hypothetical protein